VGSTNAVITKIEYKAAEVFTTDSDGNIVKTVHPLLKDAYFTLEIPANKRSPLILVGGVGFIIGNEVTVKTTRVQLKGTVISIEEKAK
jgi:hypothetical protein